MRTIMIFPEFENMDIIDCIRARFDPLANLVRPHITLVFPFESEMSNEMLSKVLTERLCDIAPFEIKLGGISKHIDSFGNYLFLNILQGFEKIVSIHHLLYENEFKEFDIGLPYVPHMTVGNVSNMQLLDAAFEELKDMDQIFTTTVRKISVEMIGENNESIIVIEMKLRSLHN